MISDLTVYSVADSGSSIDSVQCVSPARSCTGCVINGIVQCDNSLPASCKQAVIVTSESECSTRHVHNEHFITLHNKVLASGAYNHQVLKMPVPSSLNIPFWREQLQGYEDKVIVDFLEYGQGLNYF